MIALINEKIIIIVMVTPLILMNELTYVPVDFITLEIFTLATLNEE